MRTLQQAGRHHRNQNEVLRRLLRLQGLPHRTGGSRDCGVAAERVGPEGDLMRLVWR